MESPGDSVAIRVDGEEISLHDVLAGARFRGQVDFIAQAVDAALIRAAAAELKIDVSDEELQAEADEFRARRELYQAKKTEAWLAANHLSQQDWEIQLEDEILRRKLRRAVSQDRIDQYFAENKRALDAVTISHIRVTDENVARELRTQSMEGEVDFHDLARQFSIDGDTRRTGGYLGRRRRQEVDPMLTAAVFAAQAGEVAGPVRSDRGWHLVLVEALHPAQLDEETREAIADALFAEWLSARRSQAEIRTPILDEF